MFYNSVHVLQVHVLKVHVLQVHVLQVHILQVHVLQVHVLQVQSMFYKFSPCFTTCQIWLGKNTRSCTHGTKLKEVKIRKFKRNTVFLLNFLIFISLSFVP
jgi:hypothetical protein